MQLPSRIEDLFTQTHEGFPAVKLKSAGEAISVENALGRANLSYQTKITRNKKHGRTFVILLVNPETTHAV
jgi:hypothetical protein